MSDAADVAKCRKNASGNSPHTMNLGYMIKILIFATQTSNYDE